MNLWTLNEKADGEAALLPDWPRSGQVKPGAYSRSLDLASVRVPRGSDQNTPHFTDVGLRVVAEKVKPRRGVTLAAEAPPGSVL